MKLLNCVLLFCLFSMTSYGKDIYIDYNSSKDCMDSYEYAKDGNVETPYLFFHLKVSDNEKVILESGEDYTPRQYKPSNTLSCKDLERDEQFVSDVNAGLVDVYIVQEHTYGFRIYKVKKAEYYYNTSIAFGSRADDYSYSYYYNQNSTGNLATKGSKADVFFEEKNDDNCLSEYNFKVSADQGRKSKAALTILPEIGVLYKKADPVPPLARGSELELRKINDYNIQDYLGLICKFYGGKPNTTTANNSGSGNNTTNPNSGSGYNPSNPNSGPVYNPNRPNSGSGYNPSRPNTGNTTTTDIGNNPPYYGTGNRPNTNSGGGYIPSGTGNGHKYEQGTTAADGTFYPNYASSGRIRVTGAKTDGVGNWINPRMGTIYLDVDRGYYVNSETGQPANGLYGGNTYKDGYMVGGVTGPTRTTTTTSETTTTYRPQPATTPAPVVEDSGCLETSTADTHIVRKKETLFAIARTYGLSVQQLRKWNKVPSNDRIYPCMRLAITAPMAVANTGKGMKSDCDEQPTYNTHVVQKGENLYSIARSYGVTFKQLKAWNGLRRNTIYPCTRLTVQAPVDYNYQRVPQAQPVVQTQPQIAYIIQAPAGTQIPAGATPVTYNYVGGKGGNTHTVRKNETLYAIAKAYGLHVNDLIRLNNLSSNLIAPGQVLIVGNAPATQAVPSNTIPQEYNYVAPTVNGDAARRQVIRAEPILSGRGDNLQEVNVNGQKRLVHVVRDDETLAGIARYYNTSVAKIRALNDMDRNEVIIPFQRLYVE